MQKISLTYKEVVVEQIETAIILFAEGKFISATTLAGVAEEILGKMLRAEGNICAIDDHERGFQILMKPHKIDEIGTKTLEKWIYDSENCARNVYKHWDNRKEEISIDTREEARRMIIRATRNYYHLEQDMTQIMQNFSSARY